MVVVVRQTTASLATTLNAAKCQRRDRTFAAPLADKLEVALATEANFLAAYAADARRPRRAPRQRNAVSLCTDPPRDPKASRGRGHLRQWQSDWDGGC